METMLAEGRMAAGAASAVLDDQAAAAEYLTFRLGNEEYGVDILKVQEIRNYETVTAIANAPAYVRGVINLRGVIVPVVDLRVLLGLAREEVGAHPVVVVLNLGRKTVGVTVDAVSDVVPLTPEQVCEAPEFSGNADATYVKGIGTIEGRMLILADIECLLDARAQTPARLPSC